MGFGAIEVGTVTPKPQSGNPKPRMFRLPDAQALINRLGFNNDGLDAFVSNVRRARFRRSGGILGLNIGKNATTPIERAADDYVDLPRGRLSACRLCDGQHLEPEHREPALAAERCRARRAAVGAAGAPGRAGAAPWARGAAVPEDRARSRRAAGRGDRDVAEGARHRRRDRDQHDARPGRGQAPDRAAPRPAACPARRSSTVRTA